MTLTGALILLWALQFAAAGTFFAADWKKDFNNYEDSLITFFAVIPGFSLVVSIIIWFFAKCPKLSADWLYGTPEEHRNSPIRGLHRYFIFAGAIILSQGLIFVDGLIRHSWWSLGSLAVVALWIYNCGVAWKIAGRDMKSINTFGVFGGSNTLSGPIPGLGWLNSYTISDPSVPNTLGYRSWIWDGESLISPVYETRWLEPELHADNWDQTDKIQGCAGIHAYLVPKDWEYLARTPRDHTRTGSATVDGISVSITCNNMSYNIATPTILTSDQMMRAIESAKWIYQTIIYGIVERFGKYVLGTSGWRSEWAVIKKLKAPNTEIGLALEKAYPEVEVIYPKGD